MFSYQYAYIFGLCGPISEIWYLQDYWSPQTFTGTRIGIEDFLWAFSFGLVAGPVYEFIKGFQIVKN